MFAILDLGLQIVSQGNNHVVEENPSQFYRVKCDLFVFKMQSKSYSTKPRDNSSVMVYNSNNNMIYNMIVAYEVSHSPTK